MTARSTGLTGRLYGEPVTHAGFGDQVAPGPDAVTLFDSTGLAIQDLAVAGAAYRVWRDSGVEAQSVRL